MPETPMPETPTPTTEKPVHRSRFARAYGSNPAHLISLVLCFVVAGYAAIRIFESDSVVGLLTWFVGALIFNDFVLFPAYSLLDRLLRGAEGGPRRDSRRRVPVVNHVRVPLLLAGLLLLLWFPLIFSKPEPAYQAATGLDTSPYLGRWLAISGAFLAISAVLYALRFGLAARSGGTGSRSGSEAKPAIPSAKATEAENPSS
jgi:hypothetical protein